MPVDTFTVTGTWANADTTPASGTVVFFANNEWDINTGVILDGAPVIVTLNDLGTLPHTDLVLNEGGYHVLVQIGPPGNTVEFDLASPDAFDVVDLSTIDAETSQFHDADIGRAAVPQGGLENQVLGKLSDDNYDTGWIDVAGAGGDVISVFGRTGAVVGAPTDVGLALVDNTADAAKPISAAQQAALDLKQPLDADLTTISGATNTSFGLSVLTQADAAALRSLAGLGTAAQSNTGAFDAAGAAATAQAAAIAASQPVDSDLTSIAGLDSSTAGTLSTDGSGWIRKTYAQLKTAMSFVKGDVGLGSVDNTADASKPVSTAQQTALNLKANLASPTFTGTVTIPTGASIVTPTGLVKGDVGLASVDNTADTAKPVSTAQQTALNLKANLASPTFTGTVTIPTGGSITAPTGLVKGDVGLGSVNNTADTAKTVAGDVTGTLGASVLAGTSNVESIIRANTLDQLAAPAANLSMNSFRLLNLASAVLGTDAVALAQLYDGWVTDPNTWTVKVCGTVSGGTSTIATSLVTASAHGLTNGMAGIVSGLSTTTGTGLANGSLYYIVGATTNTYQLALTSGGSAITFGGTSDSATIVFTGQNQFTVPVDATGYLTTGTKVSYNDGGVDYGVVRSAVNSSGTTTVTLITNSDYAIANATLTAPRFSNHGAAVGFPAGFNWTPTLTGYSSNPSSAKYRWSTNGRRIRLDIFQFGNGTSNATAHTLTTPVVSATVSAMGWTANAQAKDNNVFQAGLLSIGSNTPVLNTYGVITQTNTASGNSNISGSIEFDI